MLVFSIMLLVFGLILFLGSSAGKTVKKRRPRKISVKSDASAFFMRFSEELTLPESKSVQLAVANEAIQKKVKYYFLYEYGETGRGEWCKEITFFVQGSYAHGTSIRTQEDQCDIDVGVCFQNRPPISPRALQEHMYNAVVGHTNSIPEIKKKCVRLGYAGLYHIDLPLYYRDGDKLYLGVGDSWELSDPKSFSLWVESQVKPTEQMIRIVRYMKAWSDNVRHISGQRMVSGVALTVWVKRFYVADLREDVAFVKTCQGMLAYLESTRPASWECCMPVSPGDDLLVKLNTVQREKFRKRLRGLVNKGLVSLSSRNEATAAERWAKVFGKRFPYAVIS